MHASSLGDYEVARCWYYDTAAVGIIIANMGQQFLKEYCCMANFLLHKGLAIGIWI